MATVLIQSVEKGPLCREQHWRLTLRASGQLRCPVLLSDTDCSFTALLLADVLRSEFALPGRHLLQGIVARQIESIVYPLVRICDIEVLLSQHTMF